MSFSRVSRSNLPQQEAMEFQAEEEAAKKDIEDIRAKLQEYNEELKTVIEQIPVTEAELQAAQVRNPFGFLFRSYFVDLVEEYN